MKDNKNSYTFKETQDPTIVGYFEGDKMAVTRLLDEISLGIIFIDCQGKNIIFANKHFNSIIKGWKEEILAKICEYVETYKDNEKQLNKTQQIELEASGKKIKFGFSAYRISQELVTVFLRDITSRSIYVENKQENLLYDKLSELVAEMAHEIGNPLSGINTSLQVLLHNIALWPQEKIIDYIERTINEMNRLSEFLTKIREVSTESKMTNRPTNLKEVVDNVLTQNADLLQKKELIYKNNISEDVMVIIDKSAFHQIILNLLNNSLHILKPDEEINIYVDEIDDFYIRLVYQNNGESIPEEMMGKIFSPLYTTKQRGNGIGLAISLKLMIRMGGTMKAVPPDNGIGAKFLLYIPY